MKTSKTTAADGISLHVNEWVARDALLTVALVHGYGEHSGRYAHVGEALNRRGISLVSLDLRGHGLSAGRRGYVERFEDYRLDLNALWDVARARGDAQHIFVLGHSMGGLCVCDWLLAGGGKAPSGVVLTSPLLGFAIKVDPLKAALGRVSSRLFPGLALSTGLQGRDVCRDEQIARDYDSDPMNNKKATARWFTEATRAMERTLLRSRELTLPMLILYAGSDRIVSADVTDRFVLSLVMADRTAERLKDHFHEVLNEAPIERSRVIQRIADWLLSRAEAKAP